MLSQAPRTPRRLWAMRVGSTEAFVAAVQEAGADPVRVSKVLSHYVPEIPTAEADDLILGPKGTGRTAELFASHTSPLGALACMYVESTHTARRNYAAPVILAMWRPLHYRYKRSLLAATFALTSCVCRGSVRPGTNVSGTARIDARP